MDVENLTLDPAIIQALPVQGEIVSIARHGDTNWSTGYKVVVEVEDEDQVFFIKTLQRADAKKLAQGEFESMKLMHELIPEAIAPPIAWGIFETDPTRAFYLTYFRILTKEYPTYDSLIEIVRKIHEKESPTGKFGFHVPTFFGCREVDITWCDSWEEFFARELRSSIRFAQIVLNHDQELEELTDQLFELVVPRLLRPLQTGGRSIKPVLVFGDLYDGNVQTDKNTGSAALFDPCCFYGHFEYDLQCMTSDRYTLNYNFIDLYWRKVGASDPKADFDDRIALYALRNDFHTMGMWPRWTSVLDDVKSEMRRLLNKYPEGFEGFVDVSAESSSPVNIQRGTFPSINEKASLTGSEQSSRENNVVSIPSNDQETNLTPTTPQFSKDLSAISTPKQTTTMTPGDPKTGILSEHSVQQNEEAFKQNQQIEIASPSLPKNEDAVDLASSGEISSNFTANDEVEASISPSGEALSATTATTNEALISSATTNEAEAGLEPSTEASSSVSAVKPAGTETGGSFGAATGEPSAVTGGEFSMVADEKPSVIVAEEPHTPEDKEPSVVTDEKPPVLVADEKPSVVADEEPLASKNENPSVITDEKHRTNGIEVSSIAEAEKPSAAQVENPPLMETQNYPTVEDNNPPSAEAENGPPHPLETLSGTNFEEPSFVESKGLSNISAEESNVEAEQPTAAKVEKQSDIKGEASPSLSVASPDRKAEAVSDAKPEEPSSSRAPDVTSTPVEASFSITSANEVTSGSSAMIEPSSIVEAKELPITGTETDPPLAIPTSSVAESEESPGVSEGTSNLPAMAALSGTIANDGIKGDANPVFGIQASDATIDEDTSAFPTELKESAITTESADS